MTMNLIILTKIFQAVWKPSVIIYSDMHHSFTIATLYYILLSNFLALEFAFISS